MLHKYTRICVPLITVFLFSGKLFAVDQKVDQKIECKNNLSGIDCVEIACNEMAKIQNIKDKAAYQAVQSQWYTKIKEECSFAELENLAKIVEENKPIYTISIPKSSVADTRHFINVYLSSDKFTKIYNESLSKSYASGFVFGLSSSSNFEGNNKGISDQCSDFSPNSGSPVDDAAINTKLKKQIPVYVDYDDAEYFIWDGLLYVNYGDWPNYKNVLVQYQNFDVANSVFETIVERLSGSACAGNYLHIINAIGNKTSIKSKLIPVQKSE